MLAIKSSSNYYNAKVSGLIKWGGIIHSSKVTDNPVIFRGGRSAEWLSDRSAKFKAKKVSGSNPGKSRKKKLKRSPDIKLHTLTHKNLHGLHNQYHT